MVGEYRVDIGKSNSEIVGRLEEWLEKYDRIWLWSKETEEDSRQFFRFLVSDVARKNKKRILILSELMEKISETDSITVKNLTEEEFGQVEEIYFMYEFSDRIQRISGSVQYGSMQNLVDTGLLTEEEMFLAWLH